MDSGMPAVLMKKIAVATPAAAVHEFLLARISNARSSPGVRISTLTCGMLRFAMKYPDNMKVIAANNDGRKDKCCRAKK